MSLDKKNDVSYFSFFKKTSMPLYLLLKKSMPLYLIKYRAKNKYKLLVFSNNIFAC